MGISRENQNRILVTAKDQLRKAKNRFLRLRRPGVDALLLIVEKRKRAVRRDILSIGGEFVDELKERRFHNLNKI